MLAVTTLFIAFGLLDPLQRSVPGYTSALENHIESNASMAKQLQALSGEHANTFATKQAKAPAHTTAALARSGQGTQLHRHRRPGSIPRATSPLTLAQLRGRVVLVDFWTYSCINCQRAPSSRRGMGQRLPEGRPRGGGRHYARVRLRARRLQRVSAAGSLGVHYPIAIDNDYGTWDAYNNGSGRPST